MVMESTGSYWKPVYAVLEESGIRVLVANGEDVKARRGHKTDWNDCQFLANLLRHGMIRPSFIPPLGNSRSAGSDAPSPTVDRRCHQ